MQIFVRLILIPAFAVCSVVFSLGALAQVRVVDAGSSQENQQKVPASNNSQNDIMVNMYLQLEALQSEIQNLRGLVEEQSYQIKRMQTEQRDRYLDTDSRLSEINSQVQSYHSGQPIAGISPAPSVINPITDSSANANGSSNLTANNQPLTNPVAGGAGVAVASPQTEQQLYREALNLLLEDEAFTERQFLCYNGESANFRRMTRPQLPCFGLARFIVKWVKTSRPHHNGDELHKTIRRVFPRLKLPMNT